MGARVFQYAGVLYHSILLSFNKNIGTENMLAVSKEHMHTYTHIFGIAKRWAHAHWFVFSCKHVFILSMNFFFFMFLCSTFMLSFLRTRGNLCACAEVPCWAIVPGQAS